MSSFIYNFFSNPKLPNYLTLGRISAVIVIVLGLGLGDDGRNISIVLALVYLVAALSDLLDGYLARKFHNESNLGRFLDPLADKLLVFSALIMLIPLNRVHAWVAFLIITRELSITALRAIAIEKGLLISASEQGKQKTLAQNIAIFCLLWNGKLLGCDTVDVGEVVLYLALIITWWSGILYFYNFLVAMKKSNAKEKAVPIPLGPFPAPPPDYFIPYGKEESQVEGEDPETKIESTSEAPNPMPIIVRISKGPSKGAPKTSNKAAKTRRARLRALKLKKESNGVTARP
ncbi:MAG: CDP-diacylglycerol--glycerol-3-phosphate 3-phosphatidyltransferase [Deltaproteobacteria bacterium]|nr:CDP-diacylglycerol--glycerol-3-phosphate 3-phosphatidyltransferase [Deltaproteobacteria bacterium]